MTQAIDLAGDESIVPLPADVDAMGHSVQSTSPISPCQAPRARRILSDADGRVKYGAPAQPLGIRLQYICPSLAIRQFANDTCCSDSTWYIEYSSSFKDLTTSLMFFSFKALVAP